MRPIKFRVWSEKLKKLLLVDQLDLTGDEGAIVFDEDANEHYFTNSPIMQYTGLQDKNGKEIYEGDLLEVIWKDMNAYKNGEKSIHLVEYLNAAFLIKPISGYWKLGAIDPSNIIVIGNIYEHSHLLSGGQQ